MAEKSFLRHKMSIVTARLLVGLLWLLHWLPLSLLAPIGRGLGGLLWFLGRSRRRIALRNLELCFPGWSESQRRALAREHFACLGRSFIERGLLWFASAERLQRIMHIKGDIKLAERTGAPVMWLLPHFLGLDWVSAALMLNQGRPAVSMYQTQTNPVFDEYLLRGRTRFGTNALASRDQGIRAVLRWVRQGYGYVNPSDMDFGAKDSAFVPFFGVPACTLLAPSRIAHSLGMIVQPVVIKMLPGDGGYEVQVCEPLANYPTDDALADAHTLHTWLEAQILKQPDQYLWVHKRFKTRPEGEASLY